MEPILTSFRTEMNRTIPKLSPVSSVVPAGYKSNTKKPRNGNKKNFKNGYKRKRKYKIIKEQKK